jgi:DNA-binding response OmpR family regulator
MSDRTVLRVGSELTLDLDTREAWRPSVTVTLSPTEAGVLALLMRNPHRVFSARELGHELERLPSGMFLHVFELRRALGEDLIRTVHGRGYRLGIAGAERTRPQPTLQVGKLELHVRDRQVWFDDRGPVDLTAQEHRLFAPLMGRRGQLATHQELIRAGQFQSSERNLARVMSTRGPTRAGGRDRASSWFLRSVMYSLRRKLRLLTPEDLITTVHGAGYRLATEHLDLDRPEDGSLQFAGLRFRPSTRQVRGVRGRVLAPKPAAMLEQLMRAGGEVVTDDAMFDAVWGGTPSLIELDGCAQSLERILDEVGGGVTLRRVRGIGFRLSATDT